MTTPISRIFLVFGGLAVILLGTLVFASAEAREDAVPEPYELEELEKVRLVLLPTTVTDRRGRPARGLESEDFRLREDGSERSIELFAKEEELPIHLVFLLDLSGSMQLQGRLRQAKSAIRNFVDALGPEDRFGLLAFADDRIQWISRGEQDRSTFYRELDGLYAEGRTALFDALAAAPGLVAEHSAGRKALVMLTDGLDNDSEIPTLKAVWLARRVSVPIYNLSFLPMREELASRRVREGLRLLRRFSEETGGETFPIHRADEVPAAVDKIQSDLRFQYVIGYYPEDARAWDGRFRRVRLEVDRPGWTVRTRRGYYADP